MSSRKGSARPGPKPPRAAREKPEVSAEPDDRGEITLPLDGQDYHLRPSYQAIKAAETKTGLSLYELAGAAQANGLGLGDLGIITAEFMRAYAKTHPDDPLHTDHAGAKPERLEELIFEAGAMRIQPRLALLLLAALSGGVDASGEWKAVAEKKAEAPTTAD